MKFAHKWTLIFWLATGMTRHGPTHLCIHIYNFGTKSIAELLGACKSGKKSFIFSEPTQLANNHNQQCTFTTNKKLLQFICTLLRLCLTAFNILQDHIDENSFHSAKGSRFMHTAIKVCQKFSNTAPISSLVS